MYVDILACIRIKGDESEWFRIGSGVRQGCIMSPLFFNVYMGIGRRGVSFPEKMFGFLYEDDLVLCVESEEDPECDCGMVW